MGKLVLVQLTSGIDEAIVLAHAWQPGMRPLLPAVLQWCLLGVVHCMVQCTTPRPVLDNVNVTSMGHVQVAS